MGTTDPNDSGSVWNLAERVLCVCGTPPVGVAVVMVDLNSVGVLLDWFWSSGFVPMLFDPLLVPVPLTEPAGFPLKTLD